MLSIKSYLHIHIFALSVILSISWSSRDCAAGEYLQSAHGASAQRPALAGKYAIGNCAHCHEQHGSIAGLSAANGPFVYLEAETEESLCFACHDSAEANGAPDVKTDVDTVGNKGHLAQNYSNIHRTNESLSDIANNGKHIECTDCHNPHLAKATLHTTGTSGNAILTDGPLTQVTGADPDYFSTSNKYGIWEAPYQTDYTLQNPATKEYQICFKCHTGSVGDPAIWSGTSGSSTAWTDVGLEFSPYNRSGHPIITGLESYPNSIGVAIKGPGTHKGLDNLADGTALDQLLDTWTINHTMYCTDCHNGDTATGPHGSSSKWVLAGPNKAWPYLLASYNGSNQIETSSDNLFFRRLTTIGDGINTENGLFCANCHPISSYDYNSALKTNVVHVQSNHLNARCIDCHIRVPHGGKVSRLIAAVNDTTYDGHIPARYTGSGTGLNAEGGTTPILNQFDKLDNELYNKFKCYATSTALFNRDNSGIPHTCSDDHSNAIDPNYIIESW